MTLTALLALLIFWGLYSDSRAATSHRNPRVTVAQTLNRGLARTPMRGLGFMLEREAHAAGVNPYLIAAIAGKESSFGAAMCRPFNAWGLGSCDRMWRPPTFRSWRHAIRYMAGRYLRPRYLLQGARTVEGMARSYCPGCGTWARDVRGFLARFGAERTGVAYP